MVMPFVAASFLCAALLFLVQPLVARMVLPAFGGSPQVWTTAMLFFQATLVAGYAYTHFATTLLPARRQPWVHLGVALVPLLVLPIALDVTPSGSGGLGPSLELLGALAVGVAAPFALIATSGPLLQRWLSWTDHPSAQDPYFLYSAGNLGSAAGLLAYPFLLEPMLSVPDQSRAWTVGYLIAVILLASCAVLVARRRAPEQESEAIPSANDATNAGRIGWGRIGRWMAYAFVPSSLTLGVTTHISTDIAAIPLMWVVPLGLYLVTFSTAFSRIGPKALMAAHSVAPPLVVLILVIDHTWIGPRASIAAYLVLVVVGGLVGHGMLAADRPPPSMLTRFYLAVAVGGGLGGAFNALVAPIAFPFVVEHLIAAVALVALLVEGRFLGERDDPRRVARFLWSTTILAGAAALAVGQVSLSPGSMTLPALALALFVAAGMTTSYGRHLLAVAGVTALALVPPVMALSHSDFVTRTFFGVHRVQTTESGIVQYINGTTIHGTQDRSSEAARLRPTIYYAADGPMGDLMAVHGGGDIGMIGLGVGVLAAYGRAGQTLVFHEIDPAAEHIARTWFTYLDDTAADVEIVLGDGRLTVAELRNRYEWVIVDAFTSDAIPVHLITVEAIETYFEAVGEGGTVVFHISNRYLDLEPVMRGAADHMGLHAAIGRGSGEAESAWVALARTRERVDILRALGWEELSGDPILWTDQRSDLLSVLR